MNFAQMLKVLYTDELTSSISKYFWPGDEKWYPDFV